MKRKRIHYIGLFAVFACISYCIAITCSTFAYPNYDWMSQAVSDLSAADAPSLTLWNQLISVYGACTIVSVTILCVYVEDKLNKNLRLAIYVFAIMNWISYIGYDVFPLSSSGYMGQFQDIMHTYVVTSSVVLCSIVSLVLFMIGGFQDKRYRSLAFWAFIAFVVMLLGAIGVAIAPPTYFGVFERFSVLSATFFHAILGIYFFNDFQFHKKR